MENLNFQEQKDRFWSAIITLFISVLVLLFIYFYQFTRVREKQQVVTTMLINFSENIENKQDSQEPIIAQQEQPAIQEPAEVEPQPVVEPPKPVVPQQEKIITGKAEHKVKKTEEPAPKKNEIVPKNEVKPTAKKIETKEVKKEQKEVKEIKKTEPQKTITKSQEAKAKTQQPTAETSNTINNLLKNRGKKGTNNANQDSNSGDPLGGKANGDSKIGVDRKLVAFIPGTMGKGGSQPAHTCSASGSITIAYVVDKSGNVSSARRVSGSNDACIVSTTTAWVKKYVKAEKAEGSSSGTYTIVF